MVQFPPPPFPPLLPRPKRPFQEAEGQPEGGVLVLADALRTPPNIAPPLLRPEALANLCKRARKRGGEEEEKGTESEDR